MSQLIKIGPNSEHLYFYFLCQYFSYHQILRSCVNGCTGCILRRKSCWKIFIAPEHFQDLEQHPHQPKALLLLLIPVLGNHESFCTIQWDSFYFISFSSPRPTYFGRKSLLMLFHIIYAVMNWYLVQFILFQQST